MYRHTSWAVTASLVVIGLCAPPVFGGPIQYQISYLNYQQQAAFGVSYSGYNGFWQTPQHWDGTDGNQWISSGGSGQPYGTFSPDLTDVWNTATSPNPVRVRFGNYDMALTILGDFIHVQEFAQVSAGGSGYDLSTELGYAMDFELRNPDGSSLDPNSPVYYAIQYDLVGGGHYGPASDCSVDSRPCGAVLWDVTSPSSSPNSDVVTSSNSNWVGSVSQTGLWTDWRDAYGDGRFNFELKTQTTTSSYWGSGQSQLSGDFWIEFSDQPITGPLDLPSSGVPEPPGIMLLGSMACLLGIRALLRRRADQPA